MRLIEFGGAMWHLGIKSTEVTEAMRSKSGKTVAKSELPQKVCAACGRPFSWRKKWARDWEAVRYCSERCRRIGVERVNGP